MCRPKTRRPAPRCGTLSRRLQTTCLRTRAAALAIISTVYPAYATAKTVTTKEAEGLARWCQYWLIFAILGFRHN